jgi:hypothetical protein
LTLETLEDRVVPSGYTTGPLVQVSSTDLLAGNPLQSVALASDETEPQLAVDPTNPNHLVGVWHQDERLDIGSFLAVAAGASFDGGNTWHLGLVPGLEQASGGTLPQGGDPWVSIAANGDVYVSALAYDVPEDFGSTQRSQVLVAKSTDGGLTWGTPTALIDDVRTDPNLAFTNDKDALTTDPYNPRFAYDAWDRLELPPGLIGGRGKLTFTRTTDGGQTWEPARAIYDPGANHVINGAQVVVMPDDSLRLFFSELSLNVTGTGDLKLKDTLKVLRSMDHGQTWLDNGPPVTIAQMKGTAVLDPDTGNLVATDAVPDVGITVPLFDVAVDSHSGNLYTVWEDARWGGGQYNQIAFSQSTDGGQTWSEPVPINKTPSTIPAEDRPAFLPSIAVADDGTVAVTYYDFRFNDAAAGLPTDYWAIIGQPQGHKGLTDPDNWGNELRLTDHSFDLEKTEPSNGLFVGHYQGLSAIGNDFVALFAQSVSSDDPNSIFFRRISTGSPLAAAGVDPRIAALSGTAAGPAAGPTILLDNAAASLGSVANSTPREGPEFTTSANQSEQSRSDPLTVTSSEGSSPRSAAYGHHRSRGSGSFFPSAPSGLADAP